MLGYMMIRKAELRFCEYERYRTYYCGLCHALASRAGAPARLALSFEFTFLSILLTALYDDGIREEKRRCLLHPLRPRRIAQSPQIDYCADLALMAAWHDLEDGWRDERRVDKLVASSALNLAARQAGWRNPDKAGAFVHYVHALHEVERQNEPNLDIAANLTGDLLAELYVYADDAYQGDLRTLGFSVGKFIYLCDCYEDVERDLKHRAYNPLQALAERGHFAHQTSELLSAVLSEGAEAFERLPLLEDVELMRNILYSGLWQRFEMATQKRNQKNPS